MNITLELIFIRHGWTPSNEGRQFSGWSQVPLSSRGRRELEAKRQRLQQIEPFHMVIASPLTRCIETAQGLFPHIRPFLMAEFAERSFGIYEGKNLEENSKDPDFHAWAMGEDIWPASIETDEQLSRRVQHGIQKIAQIVRILHQLPPESLFNEHLAEGHEPMPLIAKAAASDVYRIAVVAHGGVIGQLTRDTTKTTEGPGHYAKNLEALNFLYTLDDTGLHFVGLRAEDDFLPHLN